MPLASLISNEDTGYRWRKRDPPIQNTQFLETFPPPPQSISPTLEYFEQYFSEELVNHIVLQSNIYAHQNGIPRNELNITLLRKYLGVLILMAVVQMPNIKLYWAAATRYAPIADYMSRDEFTKIGQIIIFHDNSASN